MEYNPYKQVVNPVNRLQKNQLAKRSLRITSVDTPTGSHRYLSNKGELMADPPPLPWSVESQFFGFEFFSLQNQKVWTHLEGENDVLVWRVFPLESIFFRGLNIPR